MGTMFGFVVVVRIDGSVKGCGGGGMVWKYRYMLEFSLGLLNVKYKILNTYCVYFGRPAAYNATYRIHAVSIPTLPAVNRPQ